MTNSIGVKSYRQSWSRTQRDIKVKKRNIFAEIIADYFSHTTLHGIGYLGVKNTTLPEKIWWMIIFTGSLSLCIYFISATYLKWKHNPVILGFEKEQTPIWEIPFPAVTICPINKVQQTKYNYTELFHRRNNLTAYEYKRFWDISLICNLHELYSEDFHSTIDITDDEAINNICEVRPIEDYGHFYLAKCIMEDGKLIMKNNSDVEFSEKANNKSLNKVAPTLNNTLFRAKWQDKEDLSIFAEHVNREGLCFTFNGLSQDDMFTKEINSNVRYIKHNIQHTNWTMENGYVQDSHMDHYPRRTAQDGFGSGLSFIVYSYLSNSDYVCGVPISGYKIILHNPVETPKAAHQYFLLSSDRKATIMIKPELITTPISLKSLSAHARKCYFSYEKSLRFFKIYTQNNCRMECAANVTKQYCGCVAFYMPRSKHSSICGFGKMKCVTEIEHKMLNFQMMEKGINKVEKEMETLEYKIFDDCDCLPPCNSLQFNAEISHAKIHMVESALASGLWNHNEGVSLKMGRELLQGTLRASQVDIFFKESEFLALRRSELYGTIDFVANCGGLLGLFLGFSLLSLIEIVYFLTLRLWCKIRQRRISNTGFQFEYPLD